MKEKAKFASKVGLVAATVGSAVGLGNVWRFPAEAQAGGGAAFLVVYIVFVFLLGIPVMVSEFALGRGGQSDAVGVFQKLSPGKKWYITGSLALLSSYCILCFYMVVSGWTFEYLWQSLTGALYKSGEVLSVNDTTAWKALFTSKMHEYIEESWGPLINTYVMIVLNLVVLMLGVRKGIERMSNILMPVLFVLLMIFCFVALSLPGAGEGLKFFFNPDFSKITPTVMIDALGQAFFSLSLGMGILITYSSYFPKETKLTRTALVVSSLDLLVAIMMGIIIFPTLMSFGLTDESVEGTTLVFVTLPEVFVNMPWTEMWSSLFFLLLTVAALTSTMSVAEVTIAFFEDHMKMRRVTACLTVILPLFVFSTICSLSLGVWNDVKIFGMNFFDFLDTFANNFLLPIVAFLTCVYLGYIAPKNFLKNELTNNGTLTSRVYPLFKFIIRYIAPVLILFILLARYF
ncbi:MAG: sodium-dependent transporter [Muribaculaceae bacterium]|nr:sodium-dependent transporter [Muribaculaceae bacterium]